MTELTTISPLTSLVLFAFTALIVGGMVLYLVLMSREKK